MKDKFIFGLRLVLGSSFILSGITKIFAMTSFIDTVSLTVVNMRGQVIRTLVDGEIRAGVHEVRWEGVTDQGNEVGTGMYIFVLRAGGKVFQKKFSLIK